MKSTNLGSSASASLEKWPQRGQADEIFVSLPVHLAVDSPLLSSTLDRDSRIGA